MRKQHNPYSFERNPLSIVYAALIFGSVSCSFYYIAFGVLAEFPTKFILITVPTLVISTSFLFLVFLSESNFERFMRHKLGKFFQSIFATLILLSFSVTYYILAIIANFTLFTSVEYRFFLLVFLGISSLISFCLIFFTRKSRLESFISFKLSESNKFYILYRIFAYIFLIVISIFVGSILYKSRLGKHDRLYFSDASHPQHNSMPFYGWILKGERKELKTNAGRQRINLHGAIDPDSLHCVMREDQTINFESTLKLLKEIERKNPLAKRLYVVVDNANYYHSKEVKEFIQDSKVELVYLPPYSPNLNLIERLWKFFHKEVLYNQYYKL